MRTPLNMVADPTFLHARALNELNRYTTGLLNLMRDMSRFSRKASISCGTIIATLQSGIVPLIKALAVSGSARVKQ